MTATAQNKIGGLSLIIGTSLVVVMLSLTPGLGLIDYVDADDFIGMGRAIQDHLALTFFAAMLGVLGLVLQLYGVLVLRRVVPSGNERRRRRHHRQIWRHGPRLGRCYLPHRQDSVVHGYPHFGIRHRRRRRTRSVLTP